jgi:hypothetical protein
VVTAAIAALPGIVGVGARRVGGGAGERLKSMVAIRIYVVRISDVVNEKINSKHGVTADEVLEVCYSSHHEAKWHDHHVMAARLLVRGKTSMGRRVEVILKPVDLDLGIWKLKTALVVGRR